MSEVFVYPVNVRYLEVDAQGVVFNSWYLAWFDDAMTAFLLHGGLPYRTMLDAGYDVQLVRTEIDWLSGVGFGDEVEVAVSTARIGTHQLRARLRGAPRPDDGDLPRTHRLRRGRRRRLGQAGDPADHRRRARRAGAAAAGLREQ